MVRPGLPTKTTKIRYSFSLAASKETRINAISLLQNGTSRYITNYTLINILDGRILKPEAVFSKGNYSVSFKISASSININEGQSIEITYMISGKKKTNVISPELKSTLFMK